MPDILLLPKKKKKANKKNIGNAPMALPLFKKDREQKHFTLLWHQVIGLITVFDAISTSRQTGLK